MTRCCLHPRTSAAYIRRIAELEAELADKRRQLDAANRTIHELITRALAEDAARTALVDNLVGQVENLQRDCDDADAFIDKAGDEFSSVLRESFAKDDRIEQLQRALLIAAPSQRQ